MNWKFFGVRHGTAGCSVWRLMVTSCGEEARICSATNVVSSYAPTEVYAQGSTCGLLFLSSGKKWPWTTSLVSKNSGEYDFNFWRTCFFQPRQRLRFPLKTLVGRFQLVLKNRCRINSDDPTKQILYSLKTLDDVLTHLNPALFLINIQPSWKHCANFSPFQIFGDNLLITVIFLCSADLRYFQQPSDDHHTSLALSNRAWRQSFPLKFSNTWSHFHLPVTLFESPLPRETTCAQHGDIHKCQDLMMAIFPTRQKFLVYSLLDVYCSFISDHWWRTWKKRGKQKRVKTMQWLLKAKITDTYFQDITLDDNTIILYFPIAQITPPAPFLLLHIHNLLK